MKRTYITAIILIANISGMMAQSPTSSRNYVVETVVKTAGKKTNSSLSSLPVDSATRTISYFDGLGRPLQTVTWQASPTGKDVVLPIEYDQYGREVKKYLPYAEQTGSDGSYRATAIAGQAAFYGTSGWDANVVKTPYPYSQAVLEASPIGRVLEQGAPGAVWQPYNAAIAGSGHTVRADYSSNV
ncbi:RHS repeat-associated core domain-containing protein, partial [Pedobacter polaris]